MGLGPRTAGNNSLPAARRVASDPCLALALSLRSCGCARKNEDIGRAPQRAAGRFGYAKPRVNTVVKRNVVISHQHMNFVTVSLIYYSMNKMTTSDTLIDLESKFHNLNTVSRLSDLERLLDEEVIEIGSTGNIYRKPNIISVLKVREVTQVRAYNFFFRAISKNLFQLIYNADVTDAKGNLHHTTRSSLWSYNSSLWKLIFHQSTISN